MATGDVAVYNELGFLKNVDSSDGQSSLCIKIKFTTD